jgi:hypothetical protein
VDQRLAVGVFGRIRVSEDQGRKRAFFEAPAVERMTGKATLLPAIQKGSARR